MDDWKPGDQAFCVKGGPINVPEDAKHFIPEGYPTFGMVYEVRNVKLVRFWAGTSGELVEVGLDLPGAPLNSDGTHFWAAQRFTKVDPLSDKEADYYTVPVLEDA